MTTTRRLAALLAFTVAAFGVTAAQAGTPGSAGRVRAAVVLVGDSNITLGGGPILQALQQRDQGYLVASVARPGAAIRLGDCTFYADATCTTRNFWKARLADTRAILSPAAWVIDLGINDAATSGTPTTVGYSDYGHKIDWLLALVGPAPVYWTNLPCQVEPSGYQPGCLTVNVALAAAPKRHPNLHVVNWAAVANGHPEWMCFITATGICRGQGGIHLTVDGYTAWASLVAGALDGRFPTK